MRIERVNTVLDTKKIVSFGDIIRNLSKNSQSKVNKIDVNYKLLSNKTIKNGRYEFTRLIN